MLTINYLDHIFVFCGAYKAYENTMGMYCMDLMCYYNIHKTESLSFTPPLQNQNNARPRGISANKIRLDRLTIVNRIQWLYRCRPVNKVTNLGRL